MRQSAQYGYVESFIGKLRDELLNGEHFYVKVERTLSLYRFTIFYSDSKVSGQKAGSLLLSKEAAIELPGPVSTNGWGYVILCGWKSPKLSTNALRPP